VERVRVHIVLPCEHEQRRSLHGLRVVRDQQLQRDLHRLGGATRVGKFIWGDSAARLPHPPCPFSSNGRSTSPVGAGVVLILGSATHLGWLRVGAENRVRPLISVFAVNPQPVSAENRVTGL
jgi:hypothetical protein